MTVTRPPPRFEDECDSDAIISELDSDIEYDSMEESELTKSTMKRVLRSYDEYDADGEESGDSDVYD